MRLAALGVGTGLLLPALAQCVEDHRVPSCNCHTCTLEQELPLCKGAPLCATSCCLLLCMQAVEEQFSELVEDILAPAPIGAEGSRQVLDATNQGSLFFLEPE